LFFSCFFPVFFLAFPAFLPVFPVVCFSLFCFSPFFLVSLVFPCLPLFFPCFPVFPLFPCFPPVSVFIFLSVFLLVFFFVSRLLVAPGSPITRNLRRKSYFCWTLTTSQLGK